MDAREVCIIITGAHKRYEMTGKAFHFGELLPNLYFTGLTCSIALAKCIEEGVNHLWTVSAIQMHPKGMIVCDEDSTLELRVKVSWLFRMSFLIIPTWTFDI
jgi:glucosamine-6-phosphate deaminase